MRIFHIATHGDWASALDQGHYDISTLGRTRQEEGFIHASRREQVSDTFQRYYAGKGLNLVLLTIDTDRLDASGVEWREDPVGDQTFPHLYGDLPTKAVIDVQPLDKKGGTPSFTEVFFGDVVKRMMLALMVMAFAVAGSAIAGAGHNSEVRGIGAVVGLLAGIAVAIPLHRRLR